MSDIDYEQIGHALDRQILLLDKWSKEKSEQLDYDCMFFEADADYLREAKKQIARVTALEARIVLALRLKKANLPGFIGDALRGRPVLNMVVFGGATIRGHLDALDLEDSEESG